MRVKRARHGAERRGRGGDGLESAAAHARVMVRQEGLRGLQDELDHLARARRLLLPCRTARVARRRVLFALRFRSGIIVLWCMSCLRASGGLIEGGGGLARSESEQCLAVAGRVLIGNCAVWKTRVCCALTHESPD